MSLGLTHCLLAGLDVGVHQRTILNYGYACLCLPRAAVADSTVTLRLRPVDFWHKCNPLKRERMVWEAAAYVGVEGTLLLIFKMRK